MSDHHQSEIPANSEPDLGDLEASSVAVADSLEPELPEDLRHAFTVLYGHGHLQELWTFYLSWMLHDLDLDIAPFEEFPGYSLTVRLPNEGPVVLLFTWDFSSDGEYHEIDEEIESRTLREPDIVHVHVAGTDVSVSVLRLRTRKRNIRVYERGIGEDDTLIGGWEAAVLENRGFRWLWKTMRTLMFHFAPQIRRMIVPPPRSLLMNVLESARRLHWSHSDELNTLMGPELDLKYVCFAGPNLASLEALPLELKLLIILHLRSESLRTMALVNREWCSLVTPTLWTGFTIKDNDEYNNEELHQRLRSLLRSRLRLHSIKRLAIGPCTWSWTPLLLNTMIHIWQHASHLSHLFLHEPIPDHEDPPRIWRGDFTALFFTLIECASSLRLTAFKGAYYPLTDQSVLYQFLKSQPSIRYLIDITTPGIPPQIISVPGPATFLPNLTSLRHVSSTILLSLVPGRHVSEVWVDGRAIWDSMLDLVPNALQESATPITSLGIEQSVGSDATLDGWLSQLQKAFPLLLHLSLPDPPLLSLLTDPALAIHFDHLQSIHLVSHQPIDISSQQLSILLGSMKNLHSLHVEVTNQFWTRSFPQDSASYTPEWHLSDSVPEHSCYFGGHTQDIPWT
ncbi:hypothetical protein DL93DRAFT_2232798 [Clavulina sp. PMI_390]|nr:hypothetical protein DL93DRAFT_2232798 [Clavulina sp. PMI_390]